MYDQSFSRHALERVLRKSDFRKIPAAEQEAFKNDQLTSALAAAFSDFSKPSNPLIFFLLKKKKIYRFNKLADELVARKIRENLKRIVRSRGRGRSVIVSNLKTLLEEGVPYRIYRLDVKSFYESFDAVEVIAKIDGLPRLGPHSKNLMRTILANHANMGGSGIPRGLSLSATISDLMMHDFDQRISSDPSVFFYARYVDDIIILSSSLEDSVPFCQFVESNLPVGLKLNSSKKDIVSAEKRVSPVKKSAPGVVLESLRVLNFDYLGYNFSVDEPEQEKNKSAGAHFRDVTVDIAKTKVRKIKTRIIRSFVDYERGGNWELLLDRMKFLTQNFSVYNSKMGARKLAGIYHSYPQVSDDSAGLVELDNFLRNAILSRVGRLFSKTTSKLTAQQKRTLLAQSFVKGHTNKSFVYFSAQRISEIQKCWKN